jgi:hypothetical protein
VLCISVVQKMTQYILRPSLINTYRQISFLSNLLLAYCFILESQMFLMISFHSEIFSYFGPHMLNSKYGKAKAWYRSWRCHLFRGDNTFNKELPLQKCNLLLVIHWISTMDHLCTESDRVRRQMWEKSVIGKLTRVSVYTNDGKCGGPQKKGHIPLKTVHSSSTMFSWLIF